MLVMITPDKQLLDVSGKSAEEIASLVGGHICASSIRKLLGDDKLVINGYRIGQAFDSAPAQRTKQGRPVENAIVKACPSHSVLRFRGIRAGTTLSKIVSIVQAEEKGLTYSGIASKLGITASKASAFCANLSKRGWIEIVKEG